MLQEIKRLVKHTSIYGLGPILGKVIGFLLIPLYTHYLSPKDYGVLELLDLTISVLGIFVGMGISAAIFRFYYNSEETEYRNEVISTALIFISIAVSIVVLLAIWQVSFISHLVFKNKGFERYFIWMFISFLFSIIAGVPEAYIMAKQKSAFFTTITLGTLAINLSLNIYVVAVLQKGVLGIVMVSALVRALNATFLLAYTVPRVGLKFSITKIKEMLQYSLPLIPANGGFFILTFADRFFLSHMTNLSAVGIYSLGYKFGFMISMLMVQPFNKIWQARLFEIAKQVDAKNVFGNIFTYYMSVLLIGFVGLTIFSREIIRMVSPPNFWNASTIIPVIALSYLLRGAYIYFQSGIFITKETKYIGISVSFAVVTNLALDYYLIGSIGYFGAAISALITNALMAFLMFYFSQKKYPIKYEGRRLFDLFAVATVLGISGIFIMFDSILLSIAFKTLLILFFPVFLFMTGFYKKKEKEKIGFCLSKIRGKRALSQ